MNIAGYEVNTHKKQAPSHLYKLAMKYWRQNIKKIHNIIYKRVIPLPNKICAWSVLWKTTSNDLVETHLHDAEWKSLKRLQALLYDIYMPPCIWYCRNDKSPVMEQEKRGYVGLGVG